MGTGSEIALWQVHAVAAVLNDAVVGIGNEGAHLAGRATIPG